MLYFQLASTGRTYDFPALREAVASALEHRERSLTVGLDAIGFLDDAIIRELIKALRNLREIGGSMKLHVSNPRIVNALRMMGLDRVFTIV